MSPPAGATGNLGPRKSQHLVCFLIGILGMARGCCPLGPHAVTPNSPLTFLSSFPLPRRSLWPVTPLAPSCAHGPAWVTLPTCLRISSSSPEHRRPGSLLVLSPRSCVALLFHYRTCVCLWRWVYSCPCPLSKHKGLESGQAREPEGTVLRCGP